MKRLVSLLCLLAIAITAYGQSSQTYNVFAQPQMPTSVSVSQVGTQGTTQYFYWVVAVYTGGKSAPNGPFVINTANATLSSTNYDVVTFAAPTTPVVAPTGYDVLRTTTATAPTGACACAVATAQSGSPVNDQSNTLSAYTVQTLTSYASEQLDNASAAVPQLVQYINGVKYTTSLAQAYAAEGSVLDAALATGVVIVPGIAGHTMVLDQAWLQPIGGAAATCTDIRFEDSGFANDKYRFLVAGTLSQNVVYGPSSASTIVTVGTGTAFDAAFGSGLGIGIQSTGSTCATATSFKYQITYRVL